MTGGKSPRTKGFSFEREVGAYVAWDGQKINFSHIGENELILTGLDSLKDFQTIVIEKIESFGMPVGKSVFDTVFFCGRLYESLLRLSFDIDIQFIPRKEVKMHLCNSMRAKDSNIRQALIDRFGPPGTKKTPGLTYGLKKDLWQAFALAVTYYDLHIA